MTFSDC